MQKAQTKRWLKREYGAELAAAVEDRNDGVCEDKKLRDATCKAAAWKGGDDGEGSELHAAVLGVSKETKSGEGAAVDRCEGLFKRACVQARLPHSLRHAHEGLAVFRVSCGASGSCLILPLGAR